MVKKHQNSPSPVPFFARCTVRSLFVVLGALLFVVTNHYYNAETVFSFVDFQIINKKGPVDVQITNKEAPVDEEDVQVTNQEAPVDEEAPTNVQIAHKEGPGDEETPNDVKTTNNEAPVNVHLTNNDEAPVDVQITDKAALVDVQKTDKEALVDVQITNKEAPVETVTKKSPVHVDPLAGCDLFSGKWVYDNVSYPLYKDRDCKFMFGDLACESYGRKDLEYQHWRWQPHGCDLPRFDGKKLLERLRNKRLMIVGDSLNRNLWVSLICMIDAFVPDEGSKHMKLSTSLYTFKVSEYNASIDYYWSPLLVESGHDNASHHQFNDIKVRIKSIEKHAKIWNDADILVFNSYRWWRVPTVKIFQDNSFESPEAVYKVVKMLRGYKMSLQTWSDWLVSNVDRAKTKMFFVNMAGSHERATNWGKPPGENCLTETTPITKEGYQGTGSDPAMMRIAESAIDKLKQKGLDMTMLNITQLTEYRKDAHPSIYKKIYWPLSEEQLSNPRSYSDCTHWCLPGVPDVWNELLYASIYR